MNAVAEALLAPAGAEDLVRRVAGGAPPREVWIYAGALLVHGQPARGSDNRLAVLEVDPLVLPRRYAFPDFSGIDVLIWASDTHPSYRALLIDEVLARRPAWLGVIVRTAGAWGPMTSATLDGGSGS